MENITPWKVPEKRNGEGDGERAGSVDEGGVLALRHGRRRTDRGFGARNPDEIPRREPHAGETQEDRGRGEPNRAVRFLSVLGSDAEAHEAGDIRSAAARRVPGAGQGRIWLRRGLGPPPRSHQYWGEARAGGVRWMGKGGGCWIRRLHPLRRFHSPHRRQMIFSNFLFWRFTTNLRISLALSWEVRKEGRLIRRQEMNASDGVHLAGHPDTVPWPLHILPLQIFLHHLHIAKMRCWIADI